MKSLSWFILFIPLSIALASEQIQKLPSPRFKFNKQQVEKVHKLMNMVKDKCGKGQRDKEACSQHQTLRRANRGISSPL